MVTAKLICVFVFAYVKSHIFHDVAEILQREFCHLLSLSWRSVHVAKVIHSEMCEAIAIKYLLNPNENIFTNGLQ